MDWTACLEQVRRRDQTAARALVDALYPQVARIIRSHLPRRVSVEDIAQDVFLKIFSKLEQYQGQVPFPHWVARIAYTTCLDQLRYQMRRPEDRWSDLGVEQQSKAEATLAEAAPEGAGREVEAKALVEKLLSGLKPEEQLLIRLLDLEEKSLDEVCALTGWNKTLAKVRAFRARQKLRRRLEEMEAKS